MMNEGHYYCQIKNQYGVINSAVATVTITALLTPITPSVNSRFTYPPTNTEFGMPQMEKYTLPVDLES